jgi:hypothetical protein
MQQTGDVNEHYLDHVMGLAEAKDIEASEDILASNGIKLLAKGAKIDGRVKDRLLQHRLTKPLEQMMRVVDGVAPRELGSVAEHLLDEHQLLAVICGDTTGRLIATSLRQLSLSHEVDSLLSVYAGHAEKRLEHAVGVAMLAAALAEEVPGCAPRRDPLLLAGLLHDVGELYIDPQILHARSKLDPEQWKHIAAHPIVGSRVLKDLHGAGMSVASIVLQHHERLDGFGYPQGLGEETMSSEGKVLAVAEMVMGLIESVPCPSEHADIAMKLVPGEFHRSLVDKIVTASRETKGQAPTPQTPDAPRLAKDVKVLAAQVTHLAELTTPSQPATPQAASVKRLVGDVTRRADRIVAAFMSTGLGLHNPGTLDRMLAELEPSVLLEMEIVTRELRWRVNEVERLVALRSAQLGPAERTEVRRWVGQAVEKAAAEACA